MQTQPKTTNTNNAKATVALENHAAILKAHAIKFTGNIEDANDLVQETYLRAFKYYNKYNEGSNIQGWLYTIMKNTFLNRCTSMSAKKMSYVDHSDLHLYKHENAVNRAIGKLENDEIRKSLATLPPNMSQAFMLHFEGHAYREIAVIQNAPIGTVKTRIHCAKKLLRKYLVAFNN